MDTFTYKDKEYKYFDHSYNKTMKNERSIEIPIALEFYKKFKPSQILEVGNVLSYYGIKPKHSCIDLNEGPIKKDWLDSKLVISINLDTAISISTIEHMSNPVNALKRIIYNSKNYLITFPLSYNSRLDEYICNEKFTTLIVMKKDIDKNWYELIGYPTKFYYNMDERGKYDVKYIAIMESIS